MLILFYLALALVIYLWVWPLSRDAKKLEQQTQSLGKHQLPQALALSSRSTLYPLARAFNHMLRRLQNLLSSHQDMTNAVSHELRTPLARMKFALAIIDAEKLDEKTRRQLTSLTTDVNEMESLINSLLVYAGFEQETQKLQLTSGRIGDLLDQLQATFIRTYPHKKLQLHIRDLTQQTEFICEWKLIETALQNLLNNAARFAVQNIVIEASVSDTDFQIKVNDDGPGIPAEARERVLESFVRLYDEQTEIKSSGFGLGLAIVKRIMKWHEGSVSIEKSSELGGASLILKWPRS
jgi:signal transduction histidine kinase